MSDAPSSATIAGLQGLLTDGSLTRRDIVEAHLRRIEQVNPHTNTFAEVRRDDVLAEADAADSAHGRSIAGPLDGVPLSVKDSYGIRGLRRSDGLKANAERYADRDDSVVTRLREAGALLLGHGNVPDMCVRWNTISGLYGTSRNPRDLSRSVGGSSGGDAGNVAAGLATAAIGQDLGGSIRVPASFCGVYGIRSTPGSVPNRGAWPAFPETPAAQAMGTIGPFARNVDDLQRVFGVIAARDPLDPLSLPIAPAGWAHDEPLPRIAVVREETGAVLDPEISRRLDETVSLLRGAGYDVVDGVPVDLRRAPELWAEITGTDLVHTMLERAGHLMIESGRQHVEQMFGAVALDGSVSSYNDAWIERHGLLVAWAAFSEQYPLIVAPVAGMPTPLLDFDHMLDADATTSLFDSMRSVPWVNLYGLPSLALPNGIQLVGRRFREDQIFAAALAVEAGLAPVAVATPD
ncbi:MAG TPA: amidase family protein [Terrimesophilobacter sp.]|uniref:amidase n=1 Tax=Terrimesophilobacter sp. TaxID=2906435 RepID=UPI002F924864